MWVVSSFFSHMNHGSTNLHIQLVEGETEAQKHAIAFLGASNTQEEDGKTEPAHPQAGLEFH